MGTAPRIAIDAMGGDTGPAAMVAGAALALARRDDLHFLLFGDAVPAPTQGQLQTRASRAALIATLTQRAAECAR